jgi:hypothetical protein
MILVAIFAGTNAFPEKKAKNPTHKKNDAPAKKQETQSQPKSVKSPSSTEKKDSSSTPAAAGQGWIEINVTDVLGHDLQARVELQGGAAPIAIEVPKGKLRAQAPLGKYKAYTYVYCLQTLVLIDVQEVVVKNNGSAFLPVNLVEGAAGDKTLLDFDQDCDFALDSVEVKCGSDPKNAASIPGRETLPLDERVFEKKEGWYCGELHAHSNFGGGKESVAELVKRAERSNLDFLAITDRNTVAACKDPGFKSNSVVLLPALEWGSDKRGVALIYGPRTFPAFEDRIPQAQALVDLVQAQGGFFAVAHPCFSSCPWQWGLGYVNGVEVWCRDWRGVPPMTIDQLDEDLKERVDGKLTHTIAFAAATQEMSANGQAGVFYDAELVRGLKSAVIAGSNSSAPAIALGEPATFVYAKEKSIKGILDGMRRGRTFVTTGPNGPKLHFSADILKDNTIDVSLGGIIPLGVPVLFIAQIENAKDKEVQILLNGRPQISKKIESDPFTIQFEQTPENYSEFRVRVIAKPSKPGFGPVDVLAMTSPIYAQEIELPNPKIKAIQKEGRDRERKEKDSNGAIPLPAEPGPGEIRPKTLM